MLPVGVFLRCFSLSRKMGGLVLASIIASAVIYPAAFAISNEVYKGFRADFQATTAAINVKDPGNPPLTKFVCSSTMKSFIESPLSILVDIIGQNAGSAGKVASLIVASILGGEIGWSIVICLPLQFFGVPYSTCSLIVEKVYVLIKSLFPVLVGSTLVSYSPDLSGGDVRNWYLGGTPGAEGSLLTMALPAAAKFSVLALVFSLIPIIITMSLLRSLAITFGGEPQLYGISKLI